mmetsp:Transcript_23106/g.35803  ORF Transcript_23106/g.35803 Transcript_23106/m.35803 type:complete len:122 (+) Transcript_23106:1283-1648(+)
MVAEGQEEIIDKSIPARHHAQFIALQMADEGRLNDHRFDSTQEEYEKLIRGHKLATVEYVIDATQGKGNSNPSLPSYSTPKGLLKHDVYLIRQDDAEADEAAAILDLLKPKRKGDQEFSSG